MRLPPLFVRLKIGFEGWRLPGLWVPVVLLWPLLFALLFLAFVIGLAAMLVFEPRGLGRFVRLSLGAYALLCESRGMRVDVADRSSVVLVTIV